MNFKYIFWSVYVLSLAIATVIINLLPFNSPGDQTGFILSTIVLYPFTYGIFALYPRIAIPLLRKIEAKKHFPIYRFQALLVRFGLYIFPTFAIAGALHICFNVLPNSIAEKDYMSLNGISMFLGLTIGGLNGLYSIRKHDAT